LVIFSKSYARKHSGCFFSEHSVVPMVLSYRLQDIENYHLLLENREIFIPHLYLAPPQGVTPSEFREAVKLEKKLDVKGV